MSYYCKYTYESTYMYIRAHTHTWETQIFVYWERVEACTRAPDLPGTQYIGAHIHYSEQSGIGVFIPIQSENAPSQIAWHESTIVTYCTWRHRHHIVLTDMICIHITTYTHIPDLRQVTYTRACLPRFQELRQLYVSAPLGQDNHTSCCWTYHAAAGANGNIVCVYIYIYTYMMHRLYAYIYNMNTYVTQIQANTRRFSFDFSSRAVTGTACCAICSACEM